MTVIDIRPDRYLRELRDHADFDVAAEKSNLTVTEINELLISPKYYRAVVECVRERREEVLVTERNDKISAIRMSYSARITGLQARATKLLRGFDATSG